VSVTTLGVGSPSVPSNVHAKAVSGSEVDLTWNASTGKAGVTGYRIYRNGNMVGTSTKPSYRGTMASTTPRPTTTRCPPTTPPERQRPQQHGERHHSQQHWPERSYRLGRDCRQRLQGRLELDSLHRQGGGDRLPHLPATANWAGTSTTASYQGHGLRAATTHLYSGVRLRRRWNVSARSSAVTVTTLNTHGPSVPADVHAKAVSGSEVDLTWTASTGKAGVTGYRIYRDGKLAGTSTKPSYKDQGLTAATAHLYSCPPTTRPGTSASTAAR